MCRFLFCRRDSTLSLKVFTARTIRRGDSLNTKCHVHVWIGWSSFQTCTINYVILHYNFWEKFPPPPLSLLWIVLFDYPDCFFYGQEKNENKKPRDGRLMFALEILTFQKTCCVIANYVMTLVNLSTNNLFADCSNFRWVRLLEHNNQWKGKVLKKTHRIKHNRLWASLDCRYSWFMY